MGAQRFLARLGLGWPGMKCEACGKRIWTRFNGHSALVVFPDGREVVYHVEHLPEWVVAEVGKRR